MDYHITRQSDLHSVCEMRVLNAFDLIDDLETRDLVTDNSRIPDHSLLVMKVELSTATNILREGGNTLGCKNYRKRTRIYRKTGESYMTSQTALRLLPLLMTEINAIDCSQTAVNECCDSIVELMLSEAENSLKKKGQ